MVGVACLKSDIFDIDSSSGRSPDAALIEAEAELQALVIEIETLNVLCPAAEPATRRAKIGGCRNTAYERLAELYGVIANAKPRTLAGAAVQLRRALVGLEDGMVMEQRLVASALAVVENCAGVAE